MGMIKPLGWSSKISASGSLSICQNLLAGGLNPWTPARLMVEWEPPTFLNGPTAKRCGVFPCRSSTFWFWVWRWCLVMFFFLRIGIPWVFITILHHHFGEYLRKLFSKQLKHKSFKEMTRHRPRFLIGSKYAVFLGISRSLGNGKKPSAKQLKKSRT